jgi:hypothetical protein
MKTTKPAKLILAVVVSILLAAFLGLKTDAGKLLLYDACSNRNGVDYFCPNLLRVEIDPKLDPNALSITLTNSRTTNRDVYGAGRSLFAIPHDYGNDTFAVFYEENLLGKANIFNTNNWHSHFYTLKLTKTPERIEVNFVAEGPDGPSEFVYAYELDK